MVGDSLTITAPGAVINFTGTSASTTVPNSSAGSPPKYVRLASTQPCYVRVTKGASAAVAGDLLVQPADSAVVRTHGLDTISAVQVTAGGVLQISPVEDQ